MSEGQNKVFKLLSTVTSASMQVAAGVKRKVRAILRLWRRRLRKQMLAFQFVLKVLACALVIAVLSVNALRRIPDERLKLGAQTIKYVLVMLTTGVSIFSLREETVVKATAPLQRNRFTKPGITYLFYLIVLAMLTIAASLLDDVADRRLKIAAEQSGDTRFKDSLGAANSLLVKHLQEEVRNSITQLEFASVPLEQLSVDVVMPEIAPEQVLKVEDENPEVARQLKDKVDSICKGVKPQDVLTRHDNDCEMAHGVIDAWRRSEVLLKYLDPESKLLVVMEFQFNAFIIEAKTGDCELEYTSNRYRCLSAEIRSRRGWNPWSGGKWAKAVLGSGQLISPNDFTFGFEFEAEQLKALFPQGGLLGRDTTLQYITIGACDLNNKPDESEFVKKFSPPEKLHVYITATEKNTQQLYKVERSVQRRKEPRKTLCEEFYYFPS